MFNAGHAGYGTSTIVGAALLLISGADDKSSAIEHGKSAFL